jgi:hypothetical protein
VRMEAGRALRKASALEIGRRRYHDPWARGVARHSLGTHARSGDPARHAGYISSGGTFRKAMLAFADAYADQTRRDHARLVEAIKGGIIPAEEGS